MNIKGKTVVVTGGSRGIGKATAKEFKDKEAKVVITYNRTTTKNAYKLDVSNNQSIRRFAEELTKKKIKIDVLVNNAGMLNWSFVKDQSLEDIEKEALVNFAGPIKIVSALYSLLSTDAIIINIASGAGMSPLREGVPYSAEKAGIIHFTKGLALELPKSMKVFCISPGYTATDMTGGEGVLPKEVARVIVDVVESKINLKSGENIYAPDYF